MAEQLLVQIRLRLGIARIAHQRAHLVVIVLEHAGREILSTLRHVLDLSITN
ncbi:hypothetical protein D3C83_141420 [compost metagenome]